MFSRHAILWTERLPFFKFQISWLVRATAIKAKTEIHSQDQTLSSSTAHWQRYNGKRRSITSNSRGRLPSYLCTQLTYLHQSNFERLMGQRSEPNSFFRSGFIHLWDHKKVLYNAKIKIAISATMFSFNFHYFNSVYPHNTWKTVIRKQFWGPFPQTLIHVLCCIYTEKPGFVATASQKNFSCTVLYNSSIVQFSTAQYLLYILQ